MERVDKMDILILAVADFLCGIMHIVMEFTLLHNDGIYREFLLVENLIVAIVFIYLSLSLVMNKGIVKLIAVRANIVFWFLFNIIILVFKPQTTTLILVDSIIRIPQNYTLCICGIICFLLSIISFRNIGQKLKDVGNAHE